MEVVVVTCGDVLDDVPHLVAGVLLCEGVAERLAPDILLTGDWVRLDDAVPVIKTLHHSIDRLSLISVYSIPHLTAKVNYNLVTKGYKVVTIV